MSPDQQQRTLDPRRTALADAVRALTLELVSADPSAATVDEAAILLERARVLLAEQPRSSAPADPSMALIDAHWTAARRGPFIGHHNPIAPPIEVSEHEGVVTGLATYNVAYEGPPNCVHGGMIAAGFDEVLGFCQGFTSRPGMTARLEVKYRSPTPLRQLLRYRAWIERVDGRKITLKGELRVAADDRLCAEAEGLFVSIDLDRFLNL